MTPCKDDEGCGDQRGWPCLAPRSGLIMQVMWMSTLCKAVDHGPVGVDVYEKILLGPA